LKGQKNLSKEDSTISYWRLFCKRIKIGEEVLSERFESTQGLSKN